ncbi:GntR family transcriptional regulator [Clostridium hydrogenum]|uniref:GntR family transcriptional regulator n=1 Tax=Clostridium hydrogenum TaxID=2855764 RepID=UPI002E37545F|nr:GntR family transcriptional regulator [Clostridium hydrogenum]
MDIDFNNKMPIYIQIMDYLKQMVISGEIDKGSKLPSIRELSSKLGVNCSTVQKAYVEMERQGIIQVERGMGTFVKNDAEVIMKLKKETAERLIDEFINKMKNIGFNNEDIVTSIKKREKMS